MYAGGINLKQKIPNGENEHYFVPLSLKYIHSIHWEVLDKMPPLLCKKMVEKAEK